jgi:phosphoribosyl-dephospho-CoA transferase
MLDVLTQRIQVHDLLEVDPERFLAAARFRQDPPPEWVDECLHATPFVHVRRTLEIDLMIPVGVRGVSRAQRWASFCHRHLVRSITSPQNLRAIQLPTSRTIAIPALHSLPVLETLWAGLDLLWGPAGSIGFELLTRRPVATAESDLDILIYAEQRISKQHATHLCNLVTLLPCQVDIRVETGECGFSLREYSSLSTNKLLLRTPWGEALGEDPWNVKSAHATVEQATQLARGCP